MTTGSPGGGDTRASGSGAMPSPSETWRAVLGEVRVFKRATSLGGVESLIEHRRGSEGPSSPVRPRQRCWDQLCRRRLNTGSGPNLVSGRCVVSEPGTLWPGSGICSVGQVRGEDPVQAVVAGCVEVLRP